MSDAAGADGDRRLRVDLDVDPAAEGGCPIVAESDDAASVAVNAVGDDCVVDVTTPDGEVRRGTGAVDEDCLCHAFGRVGCAPHFRRVEDGTILVTAYVDDRDAVRGLVEELRGVVDRVRLVRLAVVEGPDATEQVTFDLSSLTPKQRRGLELAVVRGYFDDDRDVRLRELADELGISKSALSQRLRTAQAKLVTDVFDGGER
ncbi:helix-turn-helix domain-containing protein [Halorubrum tebenquichense]|uniref:Bacterio-opsin activator HTH domain protein n=1 Tax=Halorubrum tebenquichense DSM 14210 TaxID=1227485 RepID=M0E0K8_9EURY|nr:helix-turn-helix domain-containing protein [Halorubrum tebenquichense]ELZ39884.1 Bacterio-opsin activator HTH domain protein [Halorubrum tebenquichense DSM 14210]